MYIVRVVTSMLVKMVKATDQALKIWKSWLETSRSQYTGDRDDIVDDERQSHLQVFSSRESNARRSGPHHSHRRHSFALVVACTSSQEYTHRNGVTNSPRSMPKCIERWRPGRASSQPIPSGRLLHMIIKNFLRQVSCGSKLLFRCPLSYCQTNGLRCVYHPR